MLAFRRLIDGALSRQASSGTASETEVYASIEER